TFFPMLVSAFVGLRSADPQEVAFLETLGATRGEIFRHLRVPSALPYLFSGARISLNLALIGAVIGEWTGADRGLGRALLVAPAPLEAVTLMAGFKPQADLPFVGVYVARERGYFKAQGLDVTIRHAVSGEHVQLLATGKIQFSTGTGGDILKRVAQVDVPLVSIAVISQRDDQAFAVRADSPIRTLKDWEGKLVGYKSTPYA